MRYDEDPERATAASRRAVAAAVAFGIDASGRYITSRQNNFSAGGSVATERTSRPRTCLSLHTRVGPLREYGIPGAYRVCARWRKTTDPSVMPSAVRRWSSAAARDPMNVRSEGNDLEETNTSPP